MEKRAANFIRVISTFGFYPGKSMAMSEPIQCTAFDGTRRIAAGALPQVALQLKAHLETRPEAAVLVFADTTGGAIDIDFRGSAEEVLARLAGDEPAPRGPGRPKLGVVAREVTLLPRHWDWLNSQPGGASVALRKRVEAARRTNDGADRQRRAQEATYRFVAAMAGNEIGFEDATRALFAGDRERFETLSAAWPADVGAHARQLAAEAFAP
jgi:hypothetical protein